MLLHRQLPWTNLLLTKPQNLLSRRKICGNPYKQLVLAKSYLSATEDERYQRGLIITDDIAISPILDFNLYSNAILNIVKNSYPKFTIGLFGGW